VSAVVQPGKNNWFVLAALLGFLALIGLGALGIGEKTPDDRRREHCGEDGKQVAYYMSKNSLSSG